MTEFSIRTSQPLKILIISLSNELPHDKTNKMTCAPSEDSDQPGHSPSLIRVFAVRMKKAWVLSYPLSAQGRLWSDWADAQADLSLRCAHIHFVGFVMRRLKLCFRCSCYSTRTGRGLNYTKKLSSVSVHLYIPKESSPSRARIPDIVNLWLILIWHLWKKKKIVQKKRFSMDIRLFSATDKVIIWW